MRWRTDCAARCCHKLSQGRSAAARPTHHFPIGARDDPNPALLVGLALGAAMTAPAFGQAQKDWQAPDIGKLADDPFGKLDADFPARKNKLVDAAFAPYTPGFSAAQHKYGPWQPIREARQKGATPPP